VRRYGVRIGALLGGLVGLVAVIVALGPPEGRPYLIGTGAVSVLFLGYVILTLDGAEGIRIRADAERWSSSALRRLGRPHWRVVDNVPFEDGDVDHVAIGPTGVLAVETKFTSFPWEVRETGLEGPLDRPVDQAKLGARRIRLFLKSRGLDVQVAPALAVWGPGSTRLVADSIDGVVLMIGREAERWHDQLPGTGHRFTDDEMARIESVLRDHISENDKTRRRGRRHPRLGLEDPVPG